MKVKSSVIRLIKRDFQDAEVSLPDEARKVTLPHGVPVCMIEGDRTEKPAELSKAKPIAGLETVATKVEAGLENDADEIKKR